MDGLMDGWMDGCVGGWMDGYGWYGCVDGWIYGQMYDVWMYTQSIYASLKVKLLYFIYSTLRWLGQVLEGGDEG